MVPARIFRSRWSALIWAAGILWTAYDVAMANRTTPRVTSANASGSATMRDASGEVVDPADLAILANVGG